MTSSNPLAAIRNAVQEWPETVPCPTCQGYDAALRSNGLLEADGRTLCQRCDANGQVPNPGRAAVLALVEAPCPGPMNDGRCLMGTADAEYCDCHGIGTVPFNLDAWLDAAPASHREAALLAFWRSVAEAAGWELRTHKSQDVYLNKITGRQVDAWVWWAMVVVGGYRQGNTETEAVEAAIRAAFSIEASE